MENELDKIWFCLEDFLFPPQVHLTIAERNPSTNIRIHRGTFWGRGPGWWSFKTNTVTITEREDVDIDIVR